MRQEKFKMERQGLINVGDEIEISEYQSFMNYSYIIEPAVAMSGCYPNAQRIKSRKGIVKNIEHTPRGFIVTAEFDEWYFYMWYQKSPWNCRILNEQMDTVVLPEMQ